MLENQTKQLKLHQRATCLLELLKKAQGEQSRQEGLLAEWRSAGAYDNVRLFTHENNYESNELHRQHQRQYDEGNIHLGTRKRDVKETNY